MEYPLHQLIRLEIMLSLFQISLAKSESSLRVIVLPSEVYPYFEPGIDKIQYANPC